MDSFKPLKTTGFMKHNGGMDFFLENPDTARFQTRIEEYHLNPGATAHGGFLMTLLDSGMGSLVHRCLEEGKKAATISFDVQFVAAAREGDWLEGRANLTQKTRSLYFVSGELSCGGQKLVCAQGIWKIL